MSNGRPRQALSLGDRVALAIQDLHRRGKLDRSQPLLRLDQRKEAAAAPYQFDAARGRVHRTGCRAVPRSSRSALYGVWEFRPADRHLACPRCRPMPTRKQDKPRPIDLPSSDLVYGILSILDQFGGVLRERGREYRRSQEGRQVRDGLQALYETLGHGERDVLQVIATALDGLRGVVADLQRSLASPNGHGSNGHAATNGRGRRRQTARTRSHNGANEP